MFETPFYHGTIRNLVVAFGTLFSNMRFERKNKNGEVEQTIRVPIAYSAKEKWVHAIEGNPDGEKGVYTALPRLGYEIVSYSYDADRKLPRANKIYCMTEEGASIAYVPVPWNVEINLYFATKTTEDSLQILEQILPAFSPEHTITFRALPELNVDIDVPLTLNSVSKEDDYDGDLETRRFVVHTISFTAKLNLFGGVNDIGLIKNVQVDLQVTNQENRYIASQDTPTSPIIENWLEDF